MKSRFFVFFLFYVYIFCFIRHNHVTRFIKMLNSCFLFMQGPELMNKYVGESERAVREVRLCLKVELCIG